MQAQAEPRTRLRAVRHVKRKAKRWRQDSRYVILIDAAAFVYRQASETTTLAALPLLLRDLRRTQTGTVDEAMDLAFGKYKRALWPMQKPSEIRELLELLARDSPRRLLEIGTARGGTLFLLTRTAAPDARVISVDLPGGMFGGGYPAWKAPLYRAFAQAEQHIDLIRGDSHSSKVLSRVQALLTDRPLDFLLIDGDHTYQGVKRDYELYSPFVRDGGLIAFHDIVPHRRQPDCQVDRFWQKISRDRKTFAFVADPDQASGGIGVLRV